LRLWGVVCVLSCSASNSAAPVVQTAGGVLEYVFRPMRLRPMWPMYGTYIATHLGLALINIENHFQHEHFHVTPDVTPLNFSPLDLKFKTPP
jgi:hypothetical protein